MLEGQLLQCRLTYGFDIPTFGKDLKGLRADKNEDRDDDSDEQDSTYKANDACSLIGQPSSMTILHHFVLPANFL